MFVLMFFGFLITSTTTRKQVVSLIIRITIIIMTMITELGLCLYVK